MRKMQILFPEPMLERLQVVAAEEDRPVSEVVRRAVERFLEQVPPGRTRKGRFPTFHGGRVQVSAEGLKAEIYREDEVES